MKLKSASLLAVTVAAGLLGSKLAYSASGEMLATPTDIEMAMQPSRENLRPEQETRKELECGKDSLIYNTVANYPKKPTPYFPGYTRVLADPHEALLAKVALIQAARKSIDISTYIFSQDASSNAYVDELRQAIRRGVNVRFMIDAGGSASLAIKDFYNPVRTLLFTEKEANDEYKKNGGQKPGMADVVIFRPIFRTRAILSTFKDRFLTHEDLKTETSDNIDRRSHDKILIIDKEDRNHAYAIVGGRNIDDSYYGVPHVDGDTYEDMELLVKDDPTSKNRFNLGNTLENHFQDLYCAKGNRWLSLPREGTELLEDFDLPTPIKDIGPELDHSLGKLLALDNVDKYYANIWGTPASVDHAMRYFNSKMVKSTISNANEEENITRSFGDTFVNPNQVYTGKTDNGDSIYEKFMTISRAAKSTIDICTPYIFLPPDEQDCLKAWVMEPNTHHHLRMLSNSVATSDSAAAMETFDFETAPAMLKEGHYSCNMLGKTYEGDFINKDETGKPRIEVLELGRIDNKMFAGNTIDGHPALASAFYGKLHAKFAIVDGVKSWVGSDNLDERSRHINSETALFVNSSVVGANLTLQFDKLAARSYHWGEKDWQTMREQPQVQKRLKIMKVIEKAGNIFPELGFGD